MDWPQSKIIGNMNLLFRTHVPHSNTLQSFFVVTLTAPRATVRVSVRLLIIAHFTCYCCCCCCYLPSCTVFSLLSKWEHFSFAWQGFSRTAGSALHMYEMLGSYNSDSQLPSAIKTQVNKKCCCSRSISARWSGTWSIVVPVLWGSLESWQHN